MPRVGGASVPLPGGGVDRNCDCDTLTSLALLGSLEDTQGRVPSRF